MKALLVDDSQIVRKILGSTLKSLGLEVVGEASNGQEGVELYTKLKPDLVFINNSFLGNPRLQAWG